MFFRQILGGIACVALLAINVAQAGDSAGQKYQFNIPAQLLIESINEISDQTETLVLFPYDLVENRKGNAVEGRFTVQEALIELLLNTGLTGGVTEKGVLMISTRSSPKEKQVVESSMNNETKISKSKKGFLAALIAAFSGGSFNTTAVGAEVDANTKPLLIEEIIVTAQKRDQVAQEVPMALSVLQEEFLASNRITNVEELGEVVPGLMVVSTRPSAFRLGMRGIVALGGPIAPVGYYIDETPVSVFGSSAPPVALWDLQRVEVLRGPQGTLFGDGSMAGTIRTVTNKPSTERLGARVQLSGFNYQDGESSYDIKGLVNIPVSDSFALRASAGYVDDEGYITNRGFNGLTDNWSEETNAKLAARWMPTDSTTVDLSYTYYDIEMGRDSEQTSPGIYDPEGSLPAGFVIPATVLDKRDLDYGLANLTIQHDFDNFSLVSATSYYDRSGSNISDLNVFIAGFFFGAPIADFLPNSTASEISISDEEKTFAQEIRLVSIGDNRLDWTVGAFYKDLDRSTVSGFDLRVNLDFGLFDPAAAGFIVPIADELGLEENSTDAESWALFGQIDYELTESVNVIAGLRYYEDDRTTLFEQITDTQVFETPAGTMYPGSGSDSALSPKLALTWEASTTTTFFASVSKGFRSGDTNVAFFLVPDLAPQDYGAETLLSYELGVKANPTDRLQTNFFVYYNDWTDLQLSFVTPDGLFNYRQNAGSARAVGAEAELLYYISDSLSLSMTGSYTDAEITETVFQGDGATEAASEGNEIPYISPFTFNIGIDYSRPFGEGMNLQATGNYAFRDGSYSDASNSENQKNKSFGLLNARIGVEWERFGVYVFGRNLNNSDATTQKTQPIGILNDVIFSVYVPPRQVGLELEANF